MSKSFQIATLAGIALVSAGCHDKADAPLPATPPPAYDAVLPNVPTPPEGTALSQESGVDVIQITFVTPIGPDSIVKYYETKLGDAPFRLVNEAKQKESTIFMAEQDGPMLWVTVKSDGATGSAVTIAGGANLQKGKKADSTKPSK